MDDCFTVWCLVGFLCYLFRADKRLSFRSPKLKKKDHTECKQKCREYHIHYFATLRCLLRLFPLLFYSVQFWWCFHWFTIFCIHYSSYFMNLEAVTNNFLGTQNFRCFPIHQWSFKGVFYWRRFLHFLSNRRIF